ncbi:PREDICTED: YLP motif-containing protein 1-like [Amphimedon queenslandica]|uniref:YLP motif-containing protein 1 n=1 Tax=Amphimedon queenslandica TaxID=400682 RepID=A0AAN0J456_AMPQE|nr:PREDICTED: YLP motif-containing protein 1-like [Amphimedon queenslandica]|eukprot:XP_019851537.1 PREDICTED: YLP motif-containing protein 1-like [Amphimedon queenslandica]
MAQIAIIFRGLPGSGKSHLAKLIKEKELQYSSSAPRILSIDTYFVDEVEKIERDPETGRRIKRKVEEYEYDVALETSYMASMFKLFNRTLSEGYFSMILVDAVNSKISDFDQFWSNAKLSGFEAFVVELKEPVEVCAKRNIHNRTREEIELLAKQWEPTPPHFLQLDVTSLLSPQDTAIDEVDMEMVDSDKEDSEEKKKDPNPLPQYHGLVPSRWEQEAMNEDMLDKLDGFKKRRRREGAVGEEGEEEEEGLSLKEYLERKQEEYSQAGKMNKKRVRWADLEEAKEEIRKKEIGFSLGGGWSKVSEDEVNRILHQPTASNEDEKETQ